MTRRRPKARLALFGGGESSCGATFSCRVLYTSGGQRTVEAPRKSRQSSPIRKRQRPIGRSSYLTRRDRCPLRGPETSTVLCRPALPVITDLESFEVLPLVSLHPAVNFVLGE